jgi:catechol 2,3-dioxygenase-like lactoylglutathione lyase family enzyme
MPQPPKESRNSNPQEPQVHGPTSLAILGLSWIGIPVQDVETMCAFCEDVLRLHPAHRCERDHAIYRTDNGDHVALYGPKSSRHDLFATGPVVGFRVGNIIAARAEMELRGIQFLGSTHIKDNGRWKYVHFRGPCGHIFELVEETLLSRLPVSTAQ